jgi:hypothetical protein
LYTEPLKHARTFSEQGRRHWNFRTKWGMKKRVKNHCYKNYVPIFVSYTPSKEVSHLAVRWLCMSGLDTGEDGALFFPPPLPFDNDLPL